MEKSKLFFIEETHQYFYDGVPIPGVHEIMDHSGFIDTEYIAPEYMDRGTFIHAITELIDIGITDYSIIPGEWVAFVCAYEMFLADHEIEVIESEELVCKQIDNMLWAGRKDRKIIIDGKKTNLDIKTGYFAKWHPMQLFAYLDDEEQSGDLYLTKSGEYKLRICKPVEMLQAEKLFNSALYKYWYDHKRNWNQLTKVLKEIK